MRIDLYPRWADARGFSAIALLCLKSTASFELFLVSFLASAIRCSIESIVDKVGPNAPRKPLACKAYFLCNRSSSYRTDQARVIHACSSR